MKHGVKMLNKVNVGEGGRFKKKTICQLPVIHLIFLLRFLGKQISNSVRYKGAQLIIKLKNNFGMLELPAGSQQNLEIIFALSKYISRYLHEPWANN